MNIAPSEILSEGKSPRKCIYSVPAQETAKHCAKFGWPLVSNTAAATKARCETRWNLLWCPKLKKWSQPLVGRSSPYCNGMWGRYCCLTSLFPIVDACLSCGDIARQSCAMVPRWRIFGDFLSPVFSVSRMQHISDMHSKFALRPHPVWKYGRHPNCDGWDLARNKKKIERNHRAKIYCPRLLCRAAIKIMKTEMKLKWENRTRWKTKMKNPKWNTKQKTTQRKCYSCSITSVMHMEHTASYRWHCICKARMKVFSLIVKRQIT